MKRSRFDEHRDQTIADRSADPVDVVGRCKAHGCPNIWTTLSTMLCRWHSAAAPHAWPQVSDELRREITDRAAARANAKTPPPLTRAQKSELLARAKAVGQKPKVPKAWALDLRQREQDGERLSEIQRAMWRRALAKSRRDWQAIDIDDEAPAPILDKLKAETQRKAEGAGVAGVPDRNAALIEA